MVIIIFNYLVLPSEANSVNPSGRLISSSQLLKRNFNNLHNQGLEISKIQMDKIAIIGNGPYHPIFQYEILRKFNIESISLIQDINVGYKILINTSESVFDTYWIYSIPSIDDLIDIAHQEYHFVTTDPNLISVLSSDPRLSEKDLILIE